METGKIEEALNGLYSVEERDNALFCEGLAMR